MPVILTVLWGRRSAKLTQSTSLRYLRLCRPEACAKERNGSINECLGTPMQGRSGLRCMQRWQPSSPHSFFWRQKWQQMPAQELPA